MAPKGSFGDLTFHTRVVYDLTVTYIFFSALIDCSIRIVFDNVQPEIFVALSGHLNYGRGERWETIRENKFGFRYSPGGAWDISLRAEEKPIFCVFQCRAGYIKGLVPDNPSLIPLYVNAICQKPYESGHLEITGAMLMELVKIGHWQDIESFDPGDDQLVNIVAFFDSAVRCLSQQGYGTLPSSRHGEQKIRTVASMINENPLQHYDTISLSQQVKLSRNALEEGFRVIYHTTVAVYIAMKRLEIAVVLLVSTVNSEEFIAAASGYSSAKSLKKAFRRHFYCTPNEIRSARKKINIRLDP